MTFSSLVHVIEILSPLFDVQFWPSFRVLGLLEQDVYVIRSSHAAVLNDIHIMGTPN